MERVPWFSNTQTEARKRSPISNKPIQKRMATKKVYLNTVAQIAGKISTALISIFLVKILTNYLDLAGYGLYSKIYNYLSIFSVVADL